MLKYQISFESIQRERSCSMRMEGRRTDRQTDMMKLIVAFRNLRTRLKTAPG